MEMIQLWLTLAGLFLILLLGIGVFLYSIRISVNPDDASTIDPLPTNNNEKEI
jgi:hypothetical protein